LLLSVVSEQSIETVGPALFSKILAYEFRYDLQQIHSSSILTENFEKKRGGAHGL
jgi:hypothetical protein